MDAAAWIPVALFFGAVLPPDSQAKAVFSGETNCKRFDHLVGNCLRAVPSAQRPQPNGQERPDEWNAVWTDVMPFNEL